MKKKLASILLLSTLIAPLAGCGGGNDTGDNSGKPSPNQTKVNIKLVENKTPGLYEEDTNKMEGYYYACVDYTGEGYYDVGSYANIRLYVDPICKVTGWLIDDSTVPLPAENKLKYKIPEEYAGQEITIKPLIKLTKSSQDIPTVQVDFKGFSTTEYENMINFVNNKATINSVEYIYKKEKDEEYLIQGENKYEIVGQDPIFSVKINSETYMVTKNEDGTPAYMYPHSTNSNTQKTELIPEDELKNKYYFYSNEKEKVSFNYVATLLSESIRKDKSLSEIAKANLTYYSYDNDFANYIVTWRYSYMDGNKEVSNVFDPNKKLELDNQTSINIYADIDKRKNFNKSEAKTAVNNTLYSEVYISTDPNNTCLKAIDSSETINEDCIYGKNLGALTDTDSTKPKDVYYIAFNKGKDGTNSRLEGIKANVKKGAVVSTNYLTKDDEIEGVKSVNYKPENYNKFNLRIENLYNTLLDFKNGIGNLADISYKYNNADDNMSIDNLKIGDKTYYFNYVKTPKEVNPYSVSQNNILWLESTKFEKYILEFKNTTNDELIKKLANDFNKNDDNSLVISSIRDDSSIAKELKNKVFKFINLNRDKYNNLRKYEIVVTKSTDEFKFEVELLDRGISIDDFVKNKYKYIQSATNFSKGPSDIPALIDNKKFDYMKVKDYKESVLWQNINIVLELLENDNCYIDIKANSNVEFAYSIFDNIELRNPKYQFIIKYEPNSTKINSITTILDNQETYNLISPKDTKFDLSGDDRVITIKGNGNTLISNKKQKFDVQGITTYTHVINIESTDYVIDIDDSLNVYKVSGNTLEFVSKINKNYQSELKYYFKIDKLEYGIFTKEQNSPLSKEGLYLYNIENKKENNDIVVKNKIEFSKDPLKYVIVKDNYYKVLTNPDVNKGKPYISIPTIQGDKVVPILESGEIEIGDIINVYEGEKRIELTPDLEIYKVFNIVTSKIDVIDIISMSGETKEVYVAHQDINGESVMFIIQNTNIENEYEMVFEKVRYTIKDEASTPSI